ncbi:MAG: OmpW family protein, partial [Gemmatimonadaceae bacterium]|nr:OmpW family protein [Gemmatimonadaceae bacterium]
MRAFRPSLLVGALLALSASAGAQSTEGPWMVRVRALSLTPANKSDAIPSLNVAADKITVSDKIFPEIDIAYFFTKNFAAELV